MRFNPTFPSTDTLKRKYYLCFIYSMLTRSIHNVVNYFYDRFHKNEIVYLCATNVHIEKSDENCIIMQYKIT